MAQLPRVTQKLFATSGVNQTAVFGTMKTGSPTYSTDIATLMSGVAWGEGWNSAVTAGYAPFMEEFNAIEKINTQQIAYLLQTGIPAWDSATDYYVGDIVKVVSNGDTLLFNAIASSTNKDPMNTNGYWKRLSLGGQHHLFASIWSDYELNDQSWLRADTFSWQDGTVYDEAYQHLVDDIDEITSSTETVGSYTITYYQATDGHKIVLADQESTVLDIYNESGVAWYYILDEDNTRFKLPRENPAREELIQAVRAKGNGNALGLKSGNTDSWLICRTASTVASSIYISTTDGVAGQTGTPQADIPNATFVGISTDSTKSNIVSDMTESTSVYKGRKYLYFYIGNFSQTATEQTAGLNSSLFNGKVDLNLNNMNPSATAKETIVGWGMLDYTSSVSMSALPLSATPFTAPSNGCLCVNAQGQNNAIKCYINGTESAFRQQSSNTDRDSNTMTIPLKTGDEIYFDRAASHFFTCIFYSCIGG